MADDRLDQLASHLSLGLPGDFGAKGPELRACLPLLGRMRRVYHPSFAERLTAACFDDLRGGQTRATAYAALDNIPYNRNTYLGVANRLLFILLVPASPDVALLDRIVRSSYVRSIDDFAYQRDISVGLLLRAADHKLGRELARSLNAPTDNTTFEVLERALRLCATDSRGSTIQELLGNLRRALQASGASTVRNWTLLLDYGFSHAGSGSTRLRNVRLRSLLDEVASCGNAPVLEFIRAGFEGSLAEIAAIARKV